MADDRMQPVLSGVRVTPLPSRPLIMVRLFRPSEADWKALGQAAGLALDVAPLRFAGGDPRVVWLAPGERLLMPTQPFELGGLDRACSGAHHIVDVGPGRVSFDVRGPKARELIGRGCSLDLHPRVFGPQSAARTLMAQAPVLLLQTEAQPAFEIVVDRSYGPHLAEFLRRSLEGLA